MTNARYKGQGLDKQLAEYRSKLRSAGGKHKEIQSLDIIAQHTLRSPQTQEALKKLTSTSFFGKKKRKMLGAKSVGMPSGSDTESEMKASKLEMKKKLVSWQCSIHCVIELQKCRRKVITISWCLCRKNSVYGRRNRKGYCRPGTVTNPDHYRWQECYQRQNAYKSP